MADALMAVTRHQRMSLPSASIIDSVIVPFRVAGGSLRWRVAGVAAAQRETGDRMIGWGGDNFQVSGLGHQVPGAGIQVQVQVQEICHLSISGGGWQPQVAGGGKSALCPLSSVIDAVLYSALNAVLNSALPLSLPTANRQPLTATTSFPPVLFSSGPLSSANVLPLHSSPSRRPDAA